MSPPTQGGLIRKLDDDDSSKNYRTTRHQDLVEALAEEKQMEKQNQNRRRIKYQTLIFTLCFIINCMNRLREQYIYRWAECHSS